MKIEEIRGFSNDELREKIEVWRREVFDARFKGATEPVENGAEINEKRKDIARALTILGARARGTESEPTPGQAVEKKAPKEKQRKERKKRGGVRNIRRDDTVEVISGAEKGKRGKVLRVLRDSDQIVVENINYIWKHLRKTQQNPQGGRLQKEAPLAIGKVRRVDEEEGAKKKKKK